MATVLEEKEAIREVASRYCFLVDGGRFEEWVKLFADDGVFEIIGAKPRVGHEAILALIRSLPTNEKGLPGFKHCVMNDVIEVAGETARAQWYLLLLRDGKPIQVEVAGRYEDKLVKRGGHWLFQERKVYFDFGRPGT